MYIDPIHAGQVALARTMALAARAAAPSEDSTPLESPDAIPRQRRSRPFQRLAHWWQRGGKIDGPDADPAQLMLWAECGGRPYVTALSGLLLVNHIRRNIKARRRRHILQAGGGPV